METATSALFRRRLGGAMAAVLLVVPLALVDPAPAAPAKGNPADLDTSFDGDGIVTNDLGRVGSQLALAVALQPDGKTVLGGISGHVAVPNRPPQIDFGLVRLLPDGSPDPGFGGDGSVTTDLSGGVTDKFQDLALQPDGKIVAVGGTEPDFSYFAVARYLGDGTLDAGFPNGGLYPDAWPGLAPVEQGAQAEVVALDAQGRILVGGSLEAAEVKVARLLPDGSPDPSFGEGGVVSPGPGPESVRDVFVQPDGKILVALSGSQNRLVRLLADGSPDPSFGTAGAVAMPDGPGTVLLQAAALQDDGRTVVSVAYLGLPGGPLLALARFNSDGSLDRSFGDDGLATPPAGARQVAIQPNGKIVGIASKPPVATSTAKDWVVGRNNPDGSVDTTFGDGGLVFTDIDAGPGDEVFGVAVQPDGRVVVIGAGDVEGAYQFTAVRYVGDPVPAVLCPGMAIDNVVIGTPGSDVLAGTGGGDLILGLGGDDNVSGRGGRDCLYGGTGTDAVTGGSGNDVVHIAAGDVPPGGRERISGSTGNSDTLDLAAGLDSTDVSGSPPRFSVTDPTGGIYKVAQTELIVDTP